jgi:hypothetical protein
MNGNTVLGNFIQDYSQEMFWEHFTEKQRIHSTRIIEQYSNFINNHNSIWSSEIQQKATDEQSL